MSCKQEQILAPVPQQQPLQGQAEQAVHFVPAVPMQTALGIARRAQASKVAEGAGVKRSRKSAPKRKPGLLALREIKKMQDSVATIIPKRAFQRLVREVAQDISPLIRSGSLLESMRGCCS